LRLRALQRRTLALAEDANSPEERAQHMAQAKHIGQMASSWSSNLAGVQQRKTMSETGEIIEVGADDSPSSIQIDPAKAQIGRMEILDPNNTDNVVEIDLWRRNNTMPAAVAPVVSAPSAVADDLSANANADDSDFDAAY